MIPKFRVFEKWDFDDPRPGLMWYVTILRIEDNEFVGVTKGGSEVWKKLTKKHILMQSTGLKDKNSVEIFERDIVRQVFSQPKSAGKGIVFEVVGVVKMLQGAWYIVDEKNAQMSRLWSEADENEVIGNIYENPELLEE